MFEKVPAWVDLIKTEHKTLDFWEKNGIFDKLREQNRGNAHWSFLDGPLTANNPMGVHHAWGRTLKDAYNRYWAMNGRELRYQNGFDCQGLWVEVEVEKELGFKSKTDIEKYGIAKFVDKCKERVLKYSKIQSEQSIRLGYWMDWDDSYYTMSDDNNYTIWTFLKKCHERGLIYKGHDVMPWCPRCGTGISQHEMQEGYKEVKHLSIVVRFPLRGRDKEALLVWTTTPWTLTSNVAAAVHPDLDYVKVTQGDWTYYLAANRAEAILPHGGEWKSARTLKGAELEGLTYDGPYDELPAQEIAKASHRVILWKDVSDTEGTGIVHIAPGCGKEDHDLGGEMNLPAVAPIDEGGVFVEDFGWLTGKPATEVAVDIIKDLDKKGIAYSHEKYKHSYPHCWRCSAELLFRLVDEWFIEMDPWRNEIMEVAKQIQWIPSFGYELEMDWLKNMRDWMISKKRYWGLALPIWTCQDCGSFQVIGGYDELKEKATAGWEEFDGHTPHRPWIDDVKIACDKCGKEASRIIDVGNPWLDAGIVPYSTVRYNSDREYWQKWIPADLVLECFPGQFRNWFYVLLAMSTMMENIPPFKKLVGHALVHDEHGEEMHKSKGNAIWFDDAVEEMGADIMRWIFVSQNINNTLNFGYSEAREVRGKFFNTLWNSYSFFVSYAKIADFKPTGAPPVSERPEIDRWILSQLHQLIKTARKSYEDNDARTAAKFVEGFLNRFSKWYIRQSRHRFWRSAQDMDTRAAYETPYECLKTLVQILAPMLPFVTEAIYQNLVRGCEPDAPESVHLTAFPEANEDLIDERLNEEMDALIHLSTVALSARASAGIKVRRPLRELIIDSRNEVELRAAKRFEEMLSNEINVKKVTVLPEGESIPRTLSAVPDFKVLGPKFGKKSKLVAEAISKAAPGDGDEGMSLDVEGETIDLDGSEYSVTSSAPENLAIAEDAGTTAAVVTEIDEDLRIEGVMRDLLRRFQIQRKDIGLELEDRVVLSYTTESSTIDEAFASWRDFITNELLCVEINNVQSADGDFKEVEVDGERVMVKLEKAPPTGGNSDRD